MLKAALTIERKIKTRKNPFYRNNVYISQNWSWGRCKRDHVRFDFYSCIVACWKGRPGNATAKTELLRGSLWDGCNRMRAWSYPRCAKPIIRTYTGRFIFTYIGRLDGSGITSRTIKFRAIVLQPKEASVWFFYDMPENGAYSSFNLIPKAQAFEQP